MRVGGLSSLVIELNASIRELTARHCHYVSFTKTVARGWLVPIAQVRGGMGQGGRVLGADAALAEDRVDDVATLQEGISKVGGDAEASAKTNTSRLAQSPRAIEIPCQWNAAVDIPSCGLMILQGPELVCRSDRLIDVIPAQIRAVSARSRSTRKSTKRRTFAEACRPSRCRTWIGKGGGSYSVRTRLSRPAANWPEIW